MHKDNLTISSNDYNGEPENSFDIINKYGTYEIQPTCATPNEFPKIAQGYAKKRKSKCILRQHGERPEE